MKIPIEPAAYLEFTVQHSHCDFAVGSRGLARRLGSRDAWPGNVECLGCGMYFTPDRFNQPAPASAHRLLRYWEEHPQ